MVLLAFLTKPYFISGDDGTYIALARSLRSGGYRAINLLSEQPQVQYPPLYPLILTPVASQPAGNIQVYRLWAAAWAFFALFAVAIAAHRRDPELGIVGAVPFVVSPLFGEFGTSVVSETVFVGLCYFVIARLDRFLEEKRPMAIRTIAFVIPLTLLVKSAGVALAATVAICLMRKRKWKAAVICAAAAVVILAPWWSWQARNASDYMRSHILMKDIYDLQSEYLSIPALLMERPPHNAARYVGRIAVDAMLAPFLRGIAPWTALFPLKVALSTLLSLACLAGFARRCRARGAGAEEIFVGLTTAMLLVHPVYADRYLYFILPSLYGYLLFSVGALVWRKRLAIILSSVLVLGSALSIETDLPREDLAYIECIEWLNDHGARNNVVLGRKPTAIWFYTGMKAEAYPPTTDYSRWPAHADFVIRDNYTVGVPIAEKFADVVLADTSRFTPVYRSRLDSKVMIYRHMREPGA